MATNYFDSQALWEILSERKDSDDLGTVYPKLVALADRALTDPDLAKEIVVGGFEQLPAAKEAQLPRGRPLVGMLVTAHCNTPEPIGRSKIVINWDGTIESTWARDRALVLGVNDHGQVVLTNYMNLNQRLALRMDIGEIPITGLRAPVSPARPLNLTGQHADRVLVISDCRRHYAGNDLEFVSLGPQGDALTVHFEPDGIIRLANRPHQTFQCHGFRTSANTQLFIFHHCNDDQRFIFNEDASLSPVGNPNVVWGVRDDDLILVAKEDDRAEPLTFREDFAVDGNGTEPSLEEKQAISDDAVVLALASHPGMALSVCSDERDGVKQLTLVPTADAERFIVAADHARLASGGCIIALGTRSSPE